MSSELEIDRGALEEQPLSANEKQLLSEYFQVEGRRQFRNYQSLMMFQTGSKPGLFQMLNLQTMDLLGELSDKQFTLELSQRDHWINLMQSIHEKFFQSGPSQPEVMLWTYICLEKHALVQLKTGKEEFKPMLRESQQRQLQIIGQIGEAPAQQFSREIELFYKLLDIDGISKNLIGVY